MTKFMFVIFDNKSRLYSSPFFSVRKESAMRDFLRAAESPESEIYHTPDDYDMFCIGTYEDETCTMEVWPNREFIANAYVLKIQAAGDKQ